MAFLRVCQLSDNLQKTSQFLGGSFRKKQYRYPYWHTHKGVNDIPCASNWPFIGQEWSYTLGDPDRGNYSFSNMYKTYGPVVKQVLGPHRVIVHLFHHEDLKKVYVHDGQYPVRFFYKVMSRYRKERPDIYDSPGLLPSNFRLWTLFREEFVKQHGLYLLKGQTSNMESIADDLITRVQSNQDKNGEVDVMPFLFRWALENIGMVTLGRRLGCLDVEPIPEADRLIEASHITNEVVYRNSLKGSGHEEQYRRLIRAEDYFASVIRKYVYEAIEELPRAPENEFLSTILKPGTKFNDLCTFIIDLFHEAIHKIPATTAFALYHLALNRDVQEELRLEILKELPTINTRCIEFAGPPLLYYSIRETLRLNPPTIGVARVLKKPLVLGGYNVPAATMVLMHHQVASLQEENFGDAQKFIPERWSTEAPPDMIKNLTACSPFGRGKRQCPGAALGVAQAMMGVSKFLRHFDISYHHEKIDVVNKLHNEPDRPVRLRLRQLD